MNILGISCFYHDSAACLVQDGRIVAAAQEERFTRKKHDFSFPQNAIQFCLSEGKISSAELDYVAFYDKPFVKFERILETYLAYAPRGWMSYLMAVPLWLSQKLWIPSLIEKKLNYRGKIVFTEHHESHAAAAFFPSPFQRAAFLTMDGVGEWTTTSFGTGRNSTLEILSELHFPHSLGLLYSAFTYYTGFKVNSGEYKVMGLAPYGTPKYVQTILDFLIDLKEDGSFRLNMDYFNYCAGLTMTNQKFHRLFGGPPRAPESKITRKEMDLAHSIQKVTEEVILRCVRHVFRETGEKFLCLAGGVALNCVANGRILREGPYEDIWIQPAAGDAGGALGAALFTWFTVLGNRRLVDGHTDLQRGSYLGPSFSDEQIERFLIEHRYPFHRMDETELIERTVDELEREKVIGWFQGRMEFGPRALGARSILGDARSPKMQSRMNLKIKFRESFRPFAPSILEEFLDEYFELDRPSPYMLIVAPLKNQKRCSVTEREKNLTGLEQLKVKRSTVPAITHVDYSARIQSVNRSYLPRYYQLLKRFFDRNKCPVIINTSFNVRGEPIVNTPEDAYACFMRTEMDYLVIGNFFIDKGEQPDFNERIEQRAEYEPD